MKTSDDPKKEIDLRIDYIPIFNALFSRAFEISPFDALCSMLRVDGISSANWDPFEESRKAFDDFNWMLDISMENKRYDCCYRIGLLNYCHAIEMTAPHEIIANILRSILKEGFVIDPFDHLVYRDKKKLFSYVPPSAKRKFDHIKVLARKAGESGLVDKIDLFFDENIRNAFSHSDYILTDEHFRYRKDGFTREILLGDLNKKIEACFGFYGAFIYLHRKWLKELAKTKKYHKWPRYEVLEILSSDESGVYGFNIHFSNGSKTTFSRTTEGNKAINFHFDRSGHLSFMVGDLDALEPVWKINGEPVDDWNSLE